MTAVGGCQVDDQSQLARGMVHVLTFECSFFGLVRPRQSLVEVQPAIDCASGENKSPTDSFHHLLKRKPLSDMLVKYRVSFLQILPEADRPWFLGK